MSVLVCPQCGDFPNPGANPGGPPPGCPQCGGRGEEPLVMHWQPPNPAVPKRGLPHRACDGGPLGDLAGAAAAVRRWVADRGAKPHAARWASTANPFSVTCPACRALDSFREHMVGREPPRPLLAD